MAPPQIIPRRIAPYLFSGASGVHILARMWRLNTKPASTRPLHIFLLNNSFIILVLLGGPVIYRLAHRDQRMTNRSRGAQGEEQSLIQQIGHQLRQVFTVLLIGLGIIKRRATRKQTDEIPHLVERLQRVVAEGIRAVNNLDPPNRSRRNVSEQISQS